MADTRMTLGVSLIILLHFCGVALSDTDILLKGPENGWYINGGPASSQIGSWFLYEDNLYSVCDTSATEREPTNWLRTDFIDVKDAIRVDIVVNYTVRKCQAGKKYCKEYFKLYGYQTGKTSPKPNPLVTPFDLLAQAKPTNIPARKSGPGDFNLLNVSIKTTSKGLYLAFYDQGACLSLLRVLVSFHYCPEKGKNLVSFVRTVSPYSDAGANEVEGKCTDQHSMNTTVLSAACMSHGNWKMNDSVRCFCQPGYEYVEKPEPHCKDKPENISIKISGNKKVFCKGDTVYVKCTSYGKPALVYLLYRNNVFLGRNAIGAFVVKLAEKGNDITCVPNNKLGVGQSKTEIVIAKEPPKIIGCRINGLLSTMQQVVEGDVVTVTCSISGSPPLTGRWTKGVRVWDGNDLTFNPIHRTDAGFYKFIVNNGDECNETQQEIYISVYHNSPITTAKENKAVVVVLGALFALAMVLNIILIGVIVWQHRKDSKGNSAGKKSFITDERRKMNDIAFQETSFNGKENAKQNIPEDEPKRRRGLATNNDGMPEYEEPSQPHPGMQTNNPVPHYESGDRLGQTGVVTNPPPVTYQAIQPRTVNYESLSPLTQLTPEGTVLS